MNQPTANEILCKYANEIKNTIYITFAFLNIDLDIVKILMVLMLFDTAFGVIRSLVLGDKFSFKMLFFGLSTKMLILLIPMTLALVGKGLKYDFTPMVNVVMKVLVVAEGISIFTSMYSIKTKSKVENVDFISMLLNSIRKGLTKLLKMWLGEIENPDKLNNNKDE
jgi:toxin secretion/phage lysis holin